MAHPVIKNPLLAELLKPQRIAFIVNPRAGQQLQRHLRDHVNRHLNHRKFEYGIWMTEYAGHATELAQKAIAEEYDIVTAVGGDGSINQVASVLLGTETVLGIVPAGTGNGFATHLGYSLNLEKAVRQLNTATVKTVDCGMLNGKVFVNVAGVGFDGRVSHYMDRVQRRTFLPYFWQTFKAGLAHRASPFTIEVNGEQMTDDYFSITVANGPVYGFKAQIAPGAQIDDGQFMVVLLKKATKMRYIASIPSAFRGTILQQPFVEHFSADRLVIRSTGKNYAHLDGESVVLHGDLHFEIKPNALKVLKPGL